MGFNSSGVYTPPTGAQNAAPGTVIRSSVWNTIFTDMAAALSLLGQSAWVTTPRSVTGSFTVAAVDAVVFVTGSAPTIFLPSCTVKQGQVLICSGNNTVFGTFNSILVPSGAEKVNQAATYTLNQNNTVLILVPLTSGGYLAK